MSSFSLEEAERLLDHEKELRQGKQPEFQNQVQEWGRIGREDKKSLAITLERLAQLRELGEEAFSTMEKEHISHVQKVLQQPYPRKKFRQFEPSTYIDVLTENFRQLRAQIADNPSPVVQIINAGRRPSLARSQVTMDQFCDNVYASRNRSLDITETLMSLLNLRTTHAQNRVPNLSDKIKRSLALGRFLSLSDEINSSLDDNESTCPNPVDLNGIKKDLADLPQRLANERASRIINDSSTSHSTMRTHRALDAVELFRSEGESIRNEVQKTLDIVKSLHKDSLEKKGLEDNLDRSIEEFGQEMIDAEKKLTEKCCSTPNSGQHLNGLQFLLVSDTFRLSACIDGVFDQILSHMQRLGGEQQLPQYDWLSRRLG
ncbi:hypothetical protein V5O48_017269 [Marasmius crinis-equi]|uniref:Uncharacterized protein n=1 Tax=Marasmius crinis-equi TaxID=585013 RepID=A0ABR3EPF2_9AGAR